ncbi:MAG: TIGR00282 family metallophosphoesterase [candidate division Zixibacteria bacterium]|nr:TIGR00282 family metallophosphoesterase [candidate division Zixibacteria bacterium]
MSEHIPSGPTDTGENIPETPTPDNTTSPDLPTEITIMFVADICGKPGRQAAAHLIKPMRAKHNVDYVIANIENAAGGFGITPEMSRKIFTYGVDLQTSGNHIWDRVQILEYFEQRPKLLRPANYPPHVPGGGVWVDTVRGHKLCVMNLMGRVYMNNIDCPFRVANKEINQLAENVKMVFIDFHAEATSEKQALAYYLDGKVSAVVGTHTHVQTADEKISDRGTAYLTDAGMTGPHDSIIGMEKGPSLGRFLTAMPKRFTTAVDDVKMMGVIVRVNTEDGRATHIERYQVDFDISKVSLKDTIDVDAEA